MAYSHSQLAYQERFADDGRVTARRATGVHHVDDKGRIIGRRDWDAPGEWEAPPRRIIVHQGVEGMAA
jgi:hypothetical protein